MKVIHYSQGVSKGNKIVSVKALTYKDESESVYKVELLLIKETEDIEKREIFKTQTKIDFVKYFTIDEDSEKSLVYFLISLASYKKILFFSVDLDSNNLEQTKTIYDDYVFEVIKTNQICFKSYNSRKQINTVDDVKLKYLESYIDKNNLRVFLFSGIIFPNNLTLIKIDMKSYDSEGNIRVKNFRYSGFNISKMLYNILEKDFTGDNHELVCANFFDRSNNRVINIQKIFLPNLENELIMNYDVLSIELDGDLQVNKNFKIAKIEAKSNIFYLLFFSESCLRILFFDANNFSNKFEFNFTECIGLYSKINSEKKEEDHAIIDFFKIIKIRGEERFYAFLITDNENLYIFNIDSDFTKFLLLKKIRIKEEKSINRTYLEFKIFQKNRCFFMSFTIASQNILMIYKLNMELFEVEPFSGVKLNKINPNLDHRVLYEISLNKIVLHHIITTETDINESHTLEEKLIVYNFDNYNEIVKSHSNFADSDIDVQIDLQKEIELISVLSSGFIIVKSYNGILLYDYVNNNIKYNFNLGSDLELENVYEKVLNNKIILFFRNCFLVYDWKKGIIETKTDFEHNEVLLYSIKNDKDNSLYLIFPNKLAVYSWMSMNKVNDKRYDFSVLSDNKIHMAKYKNKILVIYAEEKFIELYVFEKNDISVKRKPFACNLIGSIVEKTFLHENIIVIETCNKLYIYEYTAANEFMFTLKYMVELPEIFSLKYDLDLFKPNQEKSADCVYFIFYEREENVIKYMISFYLEEKKSLSNKMNFVSFSKSSDDSMKYNISKNRDVIYTNSKIWKSLDKKLFSSMESLYSFKINHKFDKFSYYNLPDKSRSGKLLTFCLIDHKKLNNILQVKIYSDETYAQIKDFIQIYFDRDCKINDYKIFVNKREDTLMFYLLLTNITKNLSSLISLKFEKMNMLTKKSIFLDKEIHRFSTEDASDFKIEKISNSSNRITEHILTTKKILKLDRSILFTNIQLLSDLNLLILNSNYGSLSFAQYDEFCNVQILYESSYSSHLIELSKLKNEYDNKSDIHNLFLKDETMRFMDRYEFLDTFILDKKAISMLDKKNKLDEELFDSMDSRFIFLFYNFGIIVYSIQIDNLTNYINISFDQQITFNELILKVEPRIKISSDDVLISLQTDKKVINITYNKNKFVIK